jgi:hypothetical protein
MCKGLVVTQPESPAPPASALDITSLILAVLVPIVGLVLAIVDFASAKTARRPAHALAKAALAVSITLVALEIGGGIALSVSVANAEQAAAYVPICSAIAGSPDLFTSKGPESLYGPMYTGNPTVSDRADVWNTNLAEITHWHSEVQAILQLDPGPDFGNTGGYDNGYLYSSLSQEEIMLDPATGPEGPTKTNVYDADQTVKDWTFVGLNVENVHDWANSNCPHN